MDIVLQRSAGATFLAKGPSNHWVVFDTESKFGGSEAAAKPMEMVLMALGSCTALDAESILLKMRSRTEDFRVEISSQQEEDHPRVFTKIHLKFIFSGKNLHRANIAKAVRLSQEKYCSVSAMLRKTADITYEIIYQDTEK